MIKVLLVDNHPLIRKGIEQLLKLNPLFCEIIEADNGEKAFDLANFHNPDLIILDLNIKGLSEFDTLAALKAQNVHSLTAILTVSNSEEEHDKLINAGASPFFLKNLDLEVSLSCLVKLMADDYNKKSYSALKCTAQSPEPLLDLLTKRESQILHFVAKGWRNKQIADKACISEATVKVHLKNILKKLNVNSRLSASLIYLDKQKQRENLINE